MNVFFLECGRLLILKAITHTPSEYFRNEVLYTVSNEVTKLDISEYKKCCKNNDLSFQ